MMSYAPQVAAILDTYKVSLYVVMAFVCVCIVVDCRVEHPVA